MFLPAIWRVEEHGFSGLEPIMVQGFESTLTSRTTVEIQNLPLCHRVSGATAAHTQHICWEVLPNFICTTACTLRSADFEFAVPVTTIEHAFSTTSPYQHHFA